MDFFEDVAAGEVLALPFLKKKGPLIGIKESFEPPSRFELPTC